MAGMARVLVHVQRGGAWRPAPFGQVPAPAPGGGERGARGDGGGERGARGDGRGERGARSEGVRGKTARGGMGGGVCVREAGVVPTAAGTVPSPQSVTGTFCPPHEDAAAVSCGLERGRFLLSDRPFPGSTRALLKVGPALRAPPPRCHRPGATAGRRLRSRRLSPRPAPQRPSFCPAKLLGQRAPVPLPAELRAGGVAAGVAVLLRASTGRLLLTRRAGSLRVSPGLWVPPGESRRDGAARGGGGGTGCWLPQGTPNPLFLLVGGHVEPDEEVRGQRGDSGAVWGVLAHPDPHPLSACRRP